MEGRAETVTKAFYKSVPVMAGYIVLGIGFGILLRDSGYGVAWALLMSLFIYAGSMQYVGVGLLTGGASVLTTVITTIMVNARHLFYSISMIDKYRDAGMEKKCCPKHSFGYCCIYVPYQDDHIYLNDCRRSYKEIKCRGDKYLLLSNFYFVGIG